MSGQGAALTAPAPATTSREGDDMAKRTPQERFWSKVDKTATCWLWTGALTGPLPKRGYGVFNVNGKNRVAHRIAYEWLVGPIPEGLQLDHLCRVRNCVNPSHLEPVTPAENVRRGLLTDLRSVTTHCKYGHEYTDENTIRRPGRSGRLCRTCDHADQARHRARKRAGNGVSMVLWLLSTDQPIEYDSYDGFVLLAPTEAEARQLACNERGDNPGIWLDPALSACRPLSLRSPSEPCVVLASFNAG